jgi:WXG100 family type VII secretion target
MSSISIPASWSQGVSLKVTPEILTSKSTEVANKVRTMTTHFEELKGLVDKTKGYWLGEAGDQHRQMYEDLVSDIEEILKRLGEHPVDLVTIAQKYSDVELKIQQDIAALPGDIIV